MSTKSSNIAFIAAETLNIYNLESPTGVDIRAVKSASLQTALEQVYDLAYAEGQLVVLKQVKADLNVTTAQLVGILGSLGDPA